jgi:hypothetical protein
MARLCILVQICWGNLSNLGRVYFCFFIFAGFADLPAAKEITGKTACIE